MPLYEYLCDACGQRFELIQKFSDPPPEACPKCGKGPVERQLSSPAIQFKGSGWYITDYAKKDSAPAKSDTKTESKAETKTEGKSDSSDGGKSTESKSDAKTETRSEPAKVTKPA